ncbi:MAG TPA: DUF3805 domain-containing protein [Leptospiraceae bacterium]|nr:DUF3805 domain-containing protein [Leptospiraceae bacterium]HNF26644.1 DUF3805 domain-containing protein [Leptospiraceae bacterium]HNO25593.1 DUF3805 domain-containing protein [Leptospiraceae bacterium]
MAFFLGTIEPDRKIRFFFIMAFELDYQYFKSPEGWYSFVFPDYWETEVIEGVPVFYDPQGDGALVISAFKHLTGSYDLDEEMKRFLGQHSVEYDRNCIAVFENREGSRIQACEFYSKERFWLVYMIAHRNKLIIASYNSDERPDADLSQILTRIISSIHFIVEPK